VLAGSAPAVLSHLAVSDDIAMGRLRWCRSASSTCGAIFVGLAGQTDAARGSGTDLLGHIGSITLEGNLRLRPAGP